MNEFVHIDNHAIYRGDGLICVLANTRANNVIKKKLFKILKKIGF